MQRIILTRSELKRILIDVVCDAQITDDHGQPKDLEDVVLDALHLLDKTHMKDVIYVTHIKDIDNDIFVRVDEHGQIVQPLNVFTPKNLTENFVIKGKLNT